MDDLHLYHLSDYDYQIEPDWCQLGGLKYIALKSKDLIKVLYFHFVQIFLIGR